MRSSMNNTSSERSKRSFRRDISDLFSKRRGNRESFEGLESPPALSRCTSQAIAKTSNKQSNQNTLHHGTKLLQSMFPAWDLEPLKLVFEAHKFEMEDTIAAILKMNETQSQMIEGSQEECLNRQEYTYDAIDGNILPVDFLRVRRVPLTSMLQ